MIVYICYSKNMQTIDTTNFRKNLSASLDMVNDDHEPLLITRANGRGGVLMSEEDYRTYEEMRHLTASVTNIAAINEGMAQLEAGEGVEMSLEDLRDL